MQRSGCSAFIFARARWRCLTVTYPLRRAEIRFDSKDFAVSNFLRREALRFFPARFIKYVSIRMPDRGPFGETLLDAKVRAITEGLCVNKPGGGCVEFVLTVRTHLRLFASFRDDFMGIGISPEPRRASKQKAAEWRSNQKSDA
jgi:hypothetical protein